MQIRIVASVLRRASDRKQFASLHAQLQIGELVDCIVNGSCSEEGLGRSYFHISVSHHRLTADARAALIELSRAFGTPLNRNVSAALIEIVNKHSVTLTTQLRTLHEQLCALTIAQKPINGKLGIF